jgi:hypothetical protein
MFKGNYIKEQQFSRRKITSGGAALAFQGNHIYNLINSFSRRFNPREVP